MKCPNCGAKFILKDNTYQCKYCGYVEVIEKEDNELIDNETQSQNINCNEDVEEENDEEEYVNSKNINIEQMPKKKYIKNTNYNGTKTKYNKRIEIGDNLTFLLFLGFMLMVYIISYFVGEGY